MSNQSLNPTSLRESVTAQTGRVTMHQKNLVAALAIGHDSPRPSLARTHRRSGDARARVEQSFRHAGTGRRAARGIVQQVVLGCVLAVLVMVGAGPVRAAEPHPLLENGFDPEQAFDLGEIDHVNLFNGNLIVTLPLGPQYPIREGFSYGFRLVYNSQIWAYTSCPGSDFPCDVDPTGPLDVDGNSSALLGHNQGYPNPRNNAGAGWRVTTTFGELYGPTTLHRGDSRKTGFTYVDSSGESREFRIKASESNVTGSQFVYPRYSFDGTSTLRLAIPAGGFNADGEPILAEVHRPDGVVIRYSRPLAAQEPQVPRGRWHLEQVSDSFGTVPDLEIDEVMTSITIIEEDSGGEKTIFVPDYWLVTDRHGRSHTVHFNVDGLVERVDLSGFESTTSSYHLGYAAPVRVVPGCPHDNSELVGETPRSEAKSMTHLQQVTLPDGTSTYGFGYVPPGTDGRPVCTYNDGRLKTVTLPTKGSIEYGYGAYTFPRGQCELVPLYLSESSVPRTHALVSGVVSRTMRHRDGTELGYWRYQGAPAFQWGGERNVNPNAVPPECDLPDVTYTDVYEPIQGDTYKLTRHFFSVHLPNDQGNNPEGWTHHETGLSVDRYSEDPYATGSGRFRSSMVFECEGDPDTYAYDVPIDLNDPASEVWKARRHLYIPRQCGNRSGNTVGEVFEHPDDVHGMRDRYVHYEGGQSHLCDVEGRDCENEDWRVVAERTYFWDDLHDHDYDASTERRPHWVQTRRTRPDGFGNYRTTALTSDFYDTGWQRGNRTTVVEYNSHLSDLPVETANWVLNTFDYRDTTVNGATAREDYTFDVSTGFLSSRRALRSGTGDQWNDLTVTYSDDDDGNSIQEEYTGGDIGGRYVVRNTYEAGVLARREYVENASPDAPTVLRTVDAEIDTATGLPSASWDAAGVKTAYDFDALWRLKSTTESASGVSVAAPTVYTYTPADGTNRANVTIERTPSLTLRRILLNDFGWPVREEIATPAGASSNGISFRTTGYTPQGWVRSTSTLHDSSTVGAAGTSTTTYDIFGRPREITAPDGSETLIAYQGIGRQVHRMSGVASPDGPWSLQQVHYYNASGQLIEIQQRSVDADGSNPATVQPTKYRYDEGGRVTEVIQGSQRRFFEYDRAGLLLRECHPELGFTESSCSGTSAGSIIYGGHDARGNPTTKRVGQGGSPYDLRFVYDRAERMVQVREIPSERLVTESFFTNLYGRNLPGVASCSDGEEYKCRADLGNGRLYQTKRHNRLPGVAGDTVVTETHTYAGRSGSLSRYTVRTGGEKSVPRVSFDTTFDYDSLGNLSYVGYPTCLPSECGVSVPGRSVTYGHDRGALTTVSATGLAPATLTYHPNLALHEVFHGNGVVDTHGIDPQLMVRPSRLRADKGSTTLWDSGLFSYDGVGNIAAIGNDAFTYDPVFLRLAEASVGYPHPSLGNLVETRSYDYDVYGNLLSIEGSAPRAMPVETGTNRLSDGTYDDAGNLTAHGSWQYRYGALGRLVQVEDDAGSTRRDFLYTAGGERLATLFSSGARELWTVRGADNGVLRDVEYVSTGWRWVEDYVRRGGQLLASLTDSGGGEVVRHHHLNHLGSPRVVTDATGAVVAEHVYAPFGEELTDASQDEERMKFTGHERDDLDPYGQAGDLDYMHARYYSPWWGRFLSPDPIRGRRSDPQSWNRYSYVRNRPVILAERSGRWPALFIYFSIVRPFLPTLRTNVEFLTGIYRAGPIREYQPGKGAGPLYAEHINVSHYIPVDLKYPGEAVRRDGIQANPPLDPLWFLSSGLGSKMVGAPGLFSPFFSQSNEGWKHSGRKFFLSYSAKKAAEAAAGETPSPWRVPLTTEEMVYAEWEAAYQQRLRELEEAREVDDEEDDEPQAY